MIEVANSGAELPAAIKVAPATSGFKCKAGQRKQKQSIKCIVPIFVTKYEHDFNKINKRVKSDHLKET